jgi:hypothetical protein
VVLARDCPGQHRPGFLTCGHQHGRRRGIHRAGGVRLAPSARSCRSGHRLQTSAPGLCSCRGAPGT